MPGGGQERYKDTLIGKKTKQSESIQEDLGCILISFMGTYESEEGAQYLPGRRLGERNSLDGWSRSAYCLSLGLNLTVCIVPWRVGLLWSVEMHEKLEEWGVPSLGRGKT